ncbi:MAG: AAA family ATPase [Actinobacteria bacterium]|nr:AAA family ATPase [Actinomycetota bacterium]
MDDDVSAFASSFSRFLEAMNQTAWAERASPVRELLDRHLGQDSAVLPVVSEGYATYDHVNLQVALDAYLEADGRTHELVGLTGQQRRWMSLTDLVATAHQAGVGIGSVDLVNLPVSPDDTLACVAFGLYLIEDRGAKLAALVRAADEQSGQAEVTLEVLCDDREAARAMLAEIRTLMVERNVFRGQMLSFGEPRMGHLALGAIVFHRRPDVARDAIVMPEGLLERVERQVFAIAEQRERLRAGGQHVKRGLLLHGPPGTGKTLTVRYVAARARDHTIVVLSGGALGWVRQACGLARMLQPSVVVLEDVDLVAQHRGFVESNPLLFDVLNQMDGIEEDADVAFLLTTNRADLLEPALAARPGRVDLALEIPLPDEEGRRRLLELYGRGLDLRLSDRGAIVTRTAGVTASFIKELMRKAALLSALEGDGSGAPVVEDRHVGAALDELLAEEGAMTRALLGGERRSAGPATDWLLPGDQGGAWGAGG